MAKKKKKKPKFKGKRYKLLYYKHKMDRNWKMMLMLTIALALLWVFGPVVPEDFNSGGIAYLGLFEPGSIIDKALMFGAVLSLILMFVTLSLRNRAYVQVLHDNVHIVTPFFRIKAFFKDMGQVKPIDLKLIYVKKEMKGSHKFLLPYFGKSLISMSVKAYSKSMSMINLFLPKHIFLPKERGFLLVINQWMEFSTEYDSAYAIYREANRGDTNKESIRGLY